MRCELNPPRTANEGLALPEEATAEQVEQWTRHDRYMAAAITGLLTNWSFPDGRAEISKIVDTARKIADKAVQ